MEIVERLLSGDVRALSRAISLVESRESDAREILGEIYPRTGRARIIGVTGFPGAGKSSLVDRLTAHYRSLGQRVGVIAVDPSSAFSGGAILGDRIRMQRHSADDGVFIRSMATRGTLGGLSRAAADAADLLDAAGYEIVLIETVGVGQDEIDVVQVAQCVAVVLVPGLGDDIQAIKAGILEIADVFVINKADRDGADRLHADLEGLIALTAHDEIKRRPPTSIIRTIAVRDEGTVELAKAIEQRVESDPAAAAEKRRLQCASRFITLLSEQLLKRTRDACLPEAELDRVAEEIAARRLDPYGAVDEVMKRVRFG